MSLADELMGAVRPSLQGVSRIVRNGDDEPPPAPPRVIAIRTGSRTAKIREWVKSQHYVTTGIVAEQFQISYVLASAALQRIERQGHLQSDGFVPKRVNVGGVKARRWVPT
jgi:hypothetical protein